MRDWLKIVLGVGIGAAIALTIALPIVLTGDDLVIPDDPGSQRLPGNNFVKFDDLWTGKLSTRGFGNAFSKENPQNYICTDSSGNYYSRPVEKYNIEADAENYNSCTDGATKISSDGFEAWRNDIMASGKNARSCSLSADEQWVWCSNNYMKQWRHSGYADYYVWDNKNDKQIDGLSTLKQAQYCGWSPTGHGFVCVTGDKNIKIADGETWKDVTTDGGWCDEKTRILGVEYTADNPTQCIYNGVPDWNYEEEMISTTNTIYWSPDGTQLAFASFDVSEIERLEYSVYPENLKAASPNEIDGETFEQYPRLNLIRYAKAGGKIAKTKLYVYDVTTNAKTEINAVGGAGSLAFEQGVGESQENRWFTRFAWSPDSKWFVSIWSSRDATQSKALACEVGKYGDCKPAGREDGGVKGSWSGENWQDDEAASNGHGWVGSFGPFQPVTTNTFGEYYTIYSRKEADFGEMDLHAYGMKIKDGYWNVVKQTAVESCDASYCGATWLTNSNEHQWVATSVDFYDPATDNVYFTAARSTNVGDHETTEQYKRQQFTVSSVGSDNDVECVTCSFDEDTDSCEVTSIRRNSDDSRQVLRCSGPEYPKSLIRQKIDGSWSEDWVVMEDNRALKDSHEKENLARSKRILGVWYNEDLGTYHNYEAFVPADFDANTLTKKYPVFLEVYAGPEFQKISGSWKGSWPQVHLPGAYDCITLSVDGRGSAFQGDEFMFANYMALSQTERVDQTEFVRWFIQKGPYASVVDRSRVTVYGWSYGGYTTTNIIGYGGGDRGLVFTSGVAVAPLADWRFYDAMYAERYMGFTGAENELINDPHWKNSSMIERNYIENNFANFGKAEYHLIHGTNDDNVHFLSAVQMEKGLVSAGIDFDNFFYADEDHSIRSTQTVQKHVYRNIITRIVESWGYKWNGNGDQEPTATARAYSAPSYTFENQEFNKMDEASRLASPEL